MKWLPKKSRRKSIFITILLSYMLILLFPVTAGVYLFQQIETIMVDNANRNNLGMLEQIKLMGENQFQEIDRMTVQVAFNPKLQWALSNRESDYGKSELDFFAIMEDFKNLNRVSTINNNNLLVYLNNTDSVLTSTEKADASFYFREMLVYNGQTSDWVKQNLLTGYRLKTYLPATKIRMGNTVTNVIPYIQSLPFGEKENVKGYLVAFINEQEFDQAFQQIEKSNSSIVYILDNRGQVIMSTSNGDSVRGEALRSQLGKESGYTTIEQDRDTIMLSYTTDENGWKYVSAVPMRIVLKEVMLVKKTALLLLVLILVGGIIASYTMAYRNYSPIRDVVRTILLENTHKREEEGNEIDFIKQSILRSSGEKHEMRQMLKQHAPVIQANFLSRLIKGQIVPSAISDESLAFMGVRFDYDRFGVILLEIEKCPELIKEDTEQEWAHVRYILTNIGGELLGSQGYLVEMDRSRLAILLNVVDAEPQVYEGVETFIRQLQQAIERYDLQISIAVSQFHEGLKEIGICYREALIALDYRLIKGANTVLYHKEVAGYEPHYYHYTLEDEAQLMNHAKVGDYASIERLLEQIYEANFQSDAMTPEMGKFLFIDLLSTIVKIMNGLQLTNRSPLESSIDPAKVIAECATAEEMKQKTKELYQLICASTGEEKAKYGDRRFFMICQYIDDHYNDHNMSLATLSERFQMSLQYLSTFFKKHSGENITDYIAAIRIREAKKLLADPTISIGEIAVKIGYANAVSFVRFFKKLEGVPPGKYRETLSRS